MILVTQAVSRAGAAQASLGPALWSDPVVAHVKDQAMAPAPLTVIPLTLPGNTQAPHLHFGLDLIFSQAVIQFLGYYLER